MNKYLLAIGLAALAVSGCSGDKGAPGQAPATAESQPAAAMEEAPPMAESVLRTGTIDHTRDAREFELRRSLWGVDDLIEQYGKDGHDTADLKAQRSKLIADLKALLQ